MEVSQKLSFEGVHPGSHHFPFLLASCRLLLNAENKPERFLKITGKLNKVFDFECEKHMDPIETNLGYIVERKFKVVSD